MYVTNDKDGTYGATEGEKDDRVMALGIGILTLDDMSKMRKKIEERLPERDKSIKSFKQMI